MAAVATPTRSAATRRPHPREDHPLVPLAPDARRHSAVVSERKRSATVGLNTYRYEDTTYRIITEPRCRTCTADDRTSIEMLVAAGVPYAEIARRYPRGPSAQSIRRHSIKDHVSANSEIIRCVLEEAGGDRAAVLRESVPAAVRRIFEAADAMAPANAALMTGTGTVTAAQGIKAARLLAEIDLVLRGEAVMQALLDAAHADLADMLSLVKAATPSATWIEIVRAIERDPNLRVYVYEASAA